MGQTHWETGPGIHDQTTRMSGVGLVSVLRLSAGRHQPLLRTELRFEEARLRDRIHAELDGEALRRTTLSATLEDTVALGALVLAPSVRADHDWADSGEQVCQRMFWRTSSNGLYQESCHAT